MTTASVSLLARARAYTRRPAGRTALAVAPLATLGLASHADATAVAGPSFNPTPSSVTYGSVQQSGTDYDSNFFYSSPGGSFTGQSLATGSNGVTGAKFYGSVAFTEIEGGVSGTLGSIQMFSLSGTAAGTLNAGDSTLPLAYTFTLGSTAGTNITNNITGWQLNVTVTSTGTNGGTGTQTITNSTGGAGLYSGTASVTVPGAANGATLSGYSATLTVNYMISGSGNGGTLSVTVPQNSIDINAVPEPSTWIILATGVAGAGFGIMRVRERRAKAAPAA